ncbi:MAG: hypothetical protein WCI61_11205 [Chloroflexota bacterium]
MRYAATAMLAATTLALALAGCADPHARATAATRGAHVLMSAERASCNDSAEFLDRRFGFTASLAPAAPRVGEAVVFAATGTAPGRYILAMGVPQSIDQRTELGRVTVAEDGRAAARVTLPATPAGTCTVVWIYPESGEGLRMARPFLVP